MKSIPAGQSTENPKNPSRNCHHTGFLHASIRTVLILVYMIAGLFYAGAQPSGGPYGPVSQHYELPDVQGTIYYVAPDGHANASGLTLSQATSLESAMERVSSGDAIVMRGGTYRTGGLQLNQGITIQPYRDELPVMKGTLVAMEWQRQGSGLWRTSWSRLFPSRPAGWWRRSRLGHITPLHRFNNDMVFVDGKFLQSAGWEGEVDEDSYYIDYDRQLVFIGTNPAGHLVEITAYNVAIERVIGECHGRASDGKGPVIRGITFTQYAYRALEVEGNEPVGLSAREDHGKDVVGTSLENCTISYCSRVAAYLRGDNLTIRNCLVSHTSTEGIYIIGSSNVLLEKNIFRQNNIEQLTGYYPAAVKIFNQSYDVTCQDNLVIDHPYSNGIWYDVGNVNGRFINNWVEGVGTIKGTDNTDPFRREYHGFFFEISKGAICAGNVFVNCAQGIFVLNSSNVQMYQNTLVNSRVRIERTERSAVGDHFGWHPSTGPDVDKRYGHVFMNNLLTSDIYINRPLFATNQPQSLCERLNKPQVDKLDYNVFVRKNQMDAKPLISWSPAKNETCRESFDSPAELHEKYPEFSANSVFFDQYTGPLFKSSELGNYQILEAFPGSSRAARLPKSVPDLLGWSAKKTGFPGAYPPVH